MGARHTTSVVAPPAPMLDDEIKPDHSIPCRVCHSSTELDGWVATVFDCRRGFKDLPAERDVQVEIDFESPEFVCLGHRWRLKFGDNDDDASVLLCHLSGEKIERIDITFTLCMRNVDGKFLANQTESKAKFDREKCSILVGDREYSGAASTLLVNWSKIAESVAKGVVVEVRMKRANFATSSAPPFIPENPSACRIIQSLFMDEQSSDIVFEVFELTGKNNARKVARTEPSVFHAHRIILRNCATTLADLCESVGDQMRPIRITDVSPNIFRHLLNYIYGGKIAEGEMKLHAKEIIDASDKYGVPNLKLEAEVCLVGTTMFSVENIIDLLLYADSKNCALLKEAAMDYIVINKVEILKKVSFKDAPGTLISDVLAAVARRYETGVKGESEDDFSTLRISDLRRKVHEMGMDVDGSREMLLTVLKSTM